VIGSLTRVAACTGMLARYFSRRALALGPLRSWAARALILLTMVAFVVGAAVVAYQFMRPVGSELGVWRYVFDLTSVSVTMIVLGIFMALRLLVGGASAVRDFTAQLPVSHRERRGALLAFEATTLVLITAVLMAAMGIASTMILGPRGVLLATTPIVTGVVVYLVVTIAHNAGDLLLTLLGLRRVRSTVLLLATFAALLWLNARLVSLVGAVSLPDAPGGRALIGLNLMPWLLHTYGPWAYVLGAGGLVAVLALAAVLTAPNAHPSHHRFVNLALPVRTSGPWGVHLAYALRNQHLWLGVSLAAALFAYLAGTASVHPLWSAALLSFPGMYHYGNTRALRILHPERGPWSIWLRMVGCQTAVVGVFLAAGFGVLALARPELLAGSAEPLLGTVAAVVFAVLVGSAFPAENDNPFSALLGSLVLALILAFVGILTGLLQLPAAATVPLLAALAALAAVVSVWSIHVHETRSRHDVPQALAV